MRAYVSIATKGRARETRLLLDSLQRQTLPPVFMIIAGTAWSAKCYMNMRPLYQPQVMQTEAVA